MGCIEENPQRTFTFTFLEFEHHFALLSLLDQKLVGVNKVLIFLELVNRDKITKVGIQLEDDDDVNGLFKYWNEVKRICQQYDKHEMTILSSVTSESMGLDYYYV